MQKRVDPFVSYLKSPVWRPFFLREHPKDFLIPSSKRMNLPNLRFSFEISNLEELFWYVLGKKWLGQAYSTQDLQLYYEFIPFLARCGKFIGFRDIKLDQHEKLSSFTEKSLTQISDLPEIPIDQLDLQTTFFMSAILNALGLLSKLLGLFAGNLRAGLKHYLNYCIEQVQGLTSDKVGQHIFHTLSLGLMIGIDPRTFMDSLKSGPLYSSLEANSKLFQYFAFRLLSDISTIEEEGLLYFHQKTTPIGGFSFNASDFPNEKDTFWIAYLFESFKWLLSYDSSSIYSYIKQQLQKFDNVSSFTTFSEVRTYSRAIILLGIIFNTLMEEFESLIFHHFQKQREVDLEIITDQILLHQTETDLLQFMNRRYQFTLEIISNTVRYRRYLNQLDPLKKRLGRRLFEIISDYIKTDLNKFIKDENRGRKKKNRIEMDLVIELIHEMKTQLFFKGTIYKKKRFLAKNRYYFKRDRIIPQILQSDRLIDLEKLRIEKNRLKEVIIDIHSMTYEMEISSKNIMHEIESLIIAKIDPEFIERRLRFTINNTLFDAAFFNKAIENFQEEFEYLKPEYYLTEYLMRWQQVFDNLQGTFSNIHRILAIKIEDLREEQQQYQLTLELEEFCNNAIASLISEFDEYENGFRSHLIENYSRNTVQRLDQELSQVETTLKKKDDEIRRRSLLITNKQEKISSLRKTVINKWISQKEEFIKLITFYKEGFGLWEINIQAIDSHHQRVLEKITQIEKQIAQDIYQNRHHAARNLIEQKFPEISDEIEDYLKETRKKIDKLLPKNRKLQHLLKNIISEVTLQTIQLQKLIQHHKDEFQEKIQKDLRSHLLLEFTDYVDTRINQTRELVIDLESVLSQGIKTHFTETNVNFEKVLHSVNKQLQNFNLEVESEKDQINQEFTNSNQEKLTELYQKWEKFQQDIFQDVKIMEQKYWDGKIIYNTIELSKRENTFVLPLRTIAKTLKLSDRDVKDHIQRLIDTNRINARIDHKSNQIEVHNSDWRGWNQILGYNETHLREILYQYRKIESYYKQLIKNNEFLANKNQIQQLFLNLKDQIKEKIEKHDEFITQFNLENKMILDAIHSYNEKIGKIQKKIEDILYTIKTAENLEIFLKSNMKQVEEFINGEIHRLSVVFDRRKYTTFTKNLKWLKEREMEIKNHFQTLIESVNTEIRSQNIHSLQFISEELNRLFKAQTNLFKDDFEKFLQNLNEKFMEWERERVKISMETFLHKAQEKLSLIAHKADIAIITRIRKREFLIAAKLLKSRVKELKKAIKPWNKRFSRELKNISKISHDFKIKEIPRFKNQWKHIQEEYYSVSVESQQSAILTELILEFTKFSIKSFKHNFVPLKTYSENLHLKHKIVKQTLKSLITDGELPGKLDLTTDIYFEGSLSPDTDLVAKLNIIKNTNVRTYLFIERMKNLFSILAPILGGIGSLLSIIWYLTRLSENIFLYMAVALFCFMLIFIVWVKKGKKKLEP